MADREDGTPMLRLNWHDAQQSRPIIPTSPSISATQYRRDGSQSKLLPAKECDTPSLHSPQISAEPLKSCLPTGIHQEYGPHLRCFWSNTSHVAACLCVMGLILTSILVPASLVGLATPTDDPDSGFCDSGGNFHLNSASSFWAPSQAFEITVAFGNFSFSNAKLIDVMWDVVIGRGGQALLTFISYRVFSQCLTRLMEQSSVTISTFDSISLRGSMSVISILELIKDFLTHTTTRARFCMGWVIFASLYALFFQTLLSAMTGYVAKSTPYLQVPGGAQQPWASLTTVSYIIHDGWRLGLSGDYMLSDETTSYSSCYESWELDNYSDVELPEYSGYVGLPKECQIILSTTNYIEALGGNPSNRTSTFVDPKNYNLTIYLQAPTLNISTFNNPWYWSSISEPPLYTFLDRSQNATYNAEYVQEHSTCNPEKTYQWGFSGLLLSYVIILTTFWAIGMLLMWLDAHFHSKLDFYGREQGNYRAALDFATVLARELEGTEEVDMLSDMAIRRRMKTDKRTATISYTDLVFEKATVNRAMAPVDMVSVLGTALVFSIIELGLSACLFPTISFLLFTSIWTLLVTAFRIVIRLFRGNSAPDRPATAVMTLVVNAMTMVFWLAIFATLENMWQGTEAAGLVGASLAFALFLWLLFLALLALDIITLCRIVKVDRTGYNMLVKKGGLERLSMAWAWGRLKQWVWMPE